MMKGPFILKDVMYLSTLRHVVMFLGDALCLESIKTICCLPCVLLGVGTFSRCELLVL